MDIAEKIKSILVENMGVNATEVTDEAHFIRDLGIDSLDFAELVMSMEQAFEIAIPDTEAENLHTFSAAVQYVTERVGQKSAS